MVSDRALGRPSEGAVPAARGPAVASSGYQVPGPDEGDKPGLRGEAVAQRGPCPLPTALAPTPGCGVGAALSPPH